MALVVKDRVRETSTTSGTGAVTLGGAVAGFQTFAAIGNGNTTYYAIVDATTGAWEVGIGTYTASGTSLSRDTVLSSSNSGNLVNFTSNVKDVYVTYPSERSIYTDAAGTVINTNTASGTSGGVPYYSSTTTLASSAALAANAIVLGGGAGTAPATTTTGTGVVTAVGNAVNTSGGLVTQSGTLAASSLLLGGGASTAISSTTTGTGVVTAVGNAVNTSGGVVTQSGTLAASSLLLGGGASTAISSTTTGTGVVTALGVNVGTDGAFVVKGGALGTPSSGTLSNATGLPISSGVSGLGTSVATALAVNVGTAGAFVVNGGALGTPSSGTVTNLTGTASININGTVGATTPNTGAFTTLTASADSSFTSTGALLISKGTTGQQPGSPATGMLRYNTTTNSFEGYSGASPAWNPVGGASLSNDTSTSSNVYPTFASATSGSATTLYTSNAKLLYKPSTGELSASAHVSSNGINVNSNTVAASYTIASGYNGFSVGPMTVNSGVTVTVASGQRWVVA